MQGKEFFMSIVFIPTALRKFTDGKGQLDIAGSTVGEIFQALAASHPALGNQILDGGKLRGFVNVFVGDEDIRFLQGEATPVGEKDEVTLIPAIAGGF
jgi:molybdopterin synthase sulfur carrier subunit